MPGMRNKKTVNNSTPKKTKMKRLNSKSAGKYLSIVLIAFALAFINPILSVAAVGGSLVSPKVLQTITPNFLTPAHYTMPEGHVIETMSVLNPGVFECDDLQVIVAKMDQMWRGDTLTKQQYIANTVTAQALMDNQTATVGVLEGTKDTTAKVTWINSCNIVVEDDGGICTIGGEELSSSCEDYTISNGKMAGFSVNETELFGKTLSAEQIIADGIMRATAQLDEDISIAAAAFLDASTGKNLYTNRGYTITNTNTVVPATAWNYTLFPYLINAAKKNRLVNPFILSGQLLSESDIMAQLNGANADGKGALNAFNSFKKYYDLFNIDSTVGQEKLFLLSGGSIAFGSKTHYTGVRQYDGWKVFTVNSRNLTKKDGSPVVYEVWYKTRCTDNAVMHDFTIRSKYDWFLNPTGCVEPLSSGVLGFSCA
jgi:hypothetical protein